MFRFSIHRATWSLLFFLCLTATDSGFAVEKPQSQQYQIKLDHVQQNIHKVTENLQGTRSRRSNTMTELKKLELQISKNSRNINRIENDIKSLNKRIDNAGNELQQLNQALDGQRKVLADQVRSAYTQGQQDQIKMLLNQQNPADIGRIQVYFEYLNRTREQQIKDFIESIKRKQVLESELNDARSKRKLALADEANQKKQLEGQRAQRNQLIARLNIEIRNQEQTLADLKTSRDKIENLLMSLGELLADIPANPNDKQDFDKLKGRLPWPVRGQILDRFGTAKDEGNMKWRGVLIATKYGTPVRAISHGRVAFSDWLQGFGFITIVDHGNGYMSLYGHNETLLKQAGDWVNAGDVIATSGDSGGQPRPALYFEIRSHGKPVDPGNWCTSKVAQPGNHG
jgi:septal ring factor EnvC (AmiA/AmiB activator)